MSAAQGCARRQVGGVVGEYQRGEFPECIPDLRLAPGWSRDSAIVIPRLLRPSRNLGDLERLPFVRTVNGLFVCWTQEEVYSGFSDEEHGLLFGAAVILWQAESDVSSRSLLINVARATGRVGPSKADRGEGWTVSRRVMRFWNVLEEAMAHGRRPAEFWMAHLQREIGKYRRAESVRMSPVWRIVGNDEEGYHELTSRAVQPQ